MPEIHPSESTAAPWPALADGLRAERQQLQAERGRLAGAAREGDATSRRRVSAITARLKEIDDELATAADGEQHDQEEVLYRLDEAERTRRRDADAKRTALADRVHEKMRALTRRITPSGNESESRNIGMGGDHPMGPIARGF